MAAFWRNLSRMQGALAAPFASSFPMKDELIVAAVGSSATNDALSHSRACTARTKFKAMGAMFPISAVADYTLIIVYRPFRNIHVVWHPEKRPKHVKACSRRHGPNRFSTYGERHSWVPL